MCTLLIYYRMFEGSPVLLFANRDELSDRPWDPPAMLSRRPAIYGPRDRAAGGTWLGVNEAGLIVTITNHLGTLTAGASLCSRGFLVSQALKQESAANARRLLEMLKPECKYFTMLLADPREAFVLDHAGGESSQTYALMRGMHVVTNSRFRDETDVKARRVLAGMADAAKDGKPGVQEAARLLGDHGTLPGQISPLCAHPPEGSKFGTVSSSVVEIGDGGEVRKFLFAGGPPCVTPFEDYTPEF